MNALIRTSCLHTSTDIYLLIKQTNFDEIWEIHSVNDFVCKSIKYISKWVSLCSDDSLLLEEDFIRQMNQYLLILLTSRASEVREFNENPDDFNILNLGGESYYDTIKSVTIKLIRAIQQHCFGKQKLASVFTDIHEFCQSFITIGLQNSEAIETLVENDEIFWKYTPSQILGAWIYFITLSTDLKAKAIITRNLDGLINIYSSCNYWNQYLLIKLFTDKLHYLIEWEKHISLVLNAACYNLDENIMQLRIVSIEFIMKLITKTSTIFELHTKDFQECFMSTIGKIITSQR